MEARSGDIYDYDRLMQTGLTKIDPFYASHGWQRSWLTETIDIKEGKKPGSQLESVYTSMDLRNTLYLVDSVKKMSRRARITGRIEHDLAVRKPPILICLQGHVRESLCADSCSPQSSNML